MKLILNKKELLEREVDKIAEKLDKKTLFGELGHPPNPEINLDKIAILTKELKWEGDNIYEIPGIPVSFAHKVCEVREVQENDNKAR